MIYPTLNVTKIIFWYFVGIFLNDFNDFSLLLLWSCVISSIKSEVADVEAANTSKGRFKDLLTWDEIYLATSGFGAKHIFLIFFNYEATSSLLYPVT